MNSRVLSVVLASCLVGLTACGPTPNQEAQPPVPLPPLKQEPVSQRGPYAVGVTTIESLAALDGSERRFPIEVWYPAAVGGDDEATSYQLMVGALVLATYPSPMKAVRDAPLDHRGSRHPVVVFSHGSGGTRIQSVYLSEYLASHGFVVVAPDHVGNTIAEEINSSNKLSLLEAARLRPADVSRALDTALDADAQWPESLLAYGLDASRVAIMGHSFGGFTAYRIAGATIDSARGDVLCEANPGDLFCKDWPPEQPFPASQHDERFRVAVAQAPGGAIVFEDDGLSQIERPFMIQAGSDDALTAYATEAVEPYAKLNSPAYLMTLQAGGHFTFSDMCALISILGIASDTFDDGCSSDNVPAATAHPLINAFALSFLRRHLLGQDEDPMALLPQQGVELKSK